MDNLENKFAITETLRIFIPGIYFTFMAGEALKSIFEVTTIVSSNQTINAFFFLLISFLIGIIIYSIDIPKSLQFFIKNLPVKQIENKLNQYANNIDLEVFYFRFYDALSTDFKQIHKLYLDIYHLSMNLLLVSLIFIPIALFDSFLFSGVLMINIIIFLLSLISTLLIFNTRIKRQFSRLTNEFLDSPEYQDFITKYNLNQK